MKIYFFLGGFILLAVIIAVLWRVTSVPLSIPSSGQVPPTSSGFIPAGGTTHTISSPPSAVSGPSSAGPTLIIPDQDGASVTVKDFVHASSTLADPSNKGNYYLTGFSSDGYAIGYSSSAQFFTIALEKEPLSETRATAENFLLETLGVSQAQLCNLRYYIGTDVHTNAVYAGKNLGFSFCPGAVALPQ